MDFPYVSFEKHFCKYGKVKVIHFCMYKTIGTANVHIYHSIKCSCTKKQWMETIQER